MFSFKKMHCETAKILFRPRYGNASISPSYENNNTRNVWPCKDQPSPHPTPSHHPPPSTPPPIALGTLPKLPIRKSFNRLWNTLMLALASNLNSVLIVVSKLLETIWTIKWQIILEDYFTCFRKRNDCQLFLLKLIDDIISALDEDHKTGAVFMDLLEAFDCLPHCL